MPAVAQLMMTKVSSIVALRPIRSPRCPATKAPTGRARKPTPKLARAAIWETASLSLGKKMVPKTRAAAVP
jgi:hypothetical protein